ncbi:hypothetical protein [Ruegeria arenilitoris]|uniref:hypothetical protein n=1 Tax=Ruegeria arenilitoris TaxID=1173585 RepID=UPI00147DD774|nr:hypothetical protein [Ruegeria arenilitoris]
MIKSAFVIEDSSIRAVAQTSGELAEECLPTTTNASSGRFPPIENALTDIIKNKRFLEAKNKV